MLSSHSFSGWLGQVLEAPDPVQEYFALNGTFSLDCVDDDANAMPIPCAYDCANITAIMGASVAINPLWQCIFFPNVTNDARRGILSQAQESVLSKAHVDTSLAKAAAVTSTISTCLSAFCEGLEGCKKIRPIVCSAPSLTINGSMFNTNATDACMQAICANHPQPLANTDIAGIGVVASYIIQFALALLGALALVTLRYLWKPESRYVSVPHGRHVRGDATSQDGSRDQDHELQVKRRPEAGANVSQESSIQGTSEFEQAPEIYREMPSVPDVYSAVVAALVEFLKAQCFSAIAICIAALVVLNSQDWWSSMDAVTLGAAGGISIIPITFTYYILACFNTDPRDHQRKSWYLYGLCFCSWALGLSVVLSPQMFKANDGSLTGELTPSAISDPQYPNACGNASPLNICPGLYPSTANTEYTFFYTLCVPVMVGLTVWQLTTLASVSKFLSAIFYKDSQANMPLFTILHLAALGLFVAPIAFFFDNIKDLFISGNISFDWTFGQILAITLWIPSVSVLVEYLIVGYKDAHDKQMPFRYSISRTF